MNCKICIYWTKEETKFKELQVGSCSNDHFLLGYHHRRAKEDDVLVEDDEGWGFLTGPDFGCIHFNKR